MAKKSEKTENLPKKIVFPARRCGFLPPVMGNTGKRCGFLSFSGWFPISFSDSAGKGDRLFCAMTMDFALKSMIVNDLRIK